MKPDYYDVVIRQHLQWILTLEDHSTLFLNCLCRHICVDVDEDECDDDADIDDDDDDYLGDDGDEQVQDNSNIEDWVMHPTSTIRQFCLFPPW